jgi:uncharacterized protein
VSTLIVLAKAPEPGRVKTRLCPPCTPREAALLAEAALVDTLNALTAASLGQRRVLVLDGAPGPWLPSGFEVIPQREGGLDARIAGAFADAGAPAVLVGMDTPQVTGELVDELLSDLCRATCDAVVGPAMDGGYWAVGVDRVDPAAFLGVPMSVPHTFRAQRRRFSELGLRTHVSRRLRDVDDYDDALAVAAEAPRSHFVACLRDLAMVPVP